jgi:hypothetical protein
VDFAQSQVFSVFAAIWGWDFFAFSSFFVCFCFFKDFLSGRGGVGMEGIEDEFSI